MNFPTLTGPTGNLGQREGNQGAAMLAGGLLKLLQQLRFASLGIDGHFAGFNLLLGGAVITEFADAEALLRTNRWSKDPAGHGAGLVQVT